MKESVLKGISFAINSAIDSDPANRRYLNELGELSILIQIESPASELNVTLKGGFVDISEAGEDSTADISVTGKAGNLLKLLSSDLSDSAALRNANVHIEGDVARMLELSQVVQKIDIDWEAMLADKIGEAPAVLISRGAKAASEEAKKAKKTLSGVVKDWLEGSNSPLPSRKSYDSLKSDLRDLQYRIDRLSTKLAVNEGDQ